MLVTLPLLVLSASVANSPFENGCATETFVLFQKVREPGDMLGTSCASNGTLGLAGFPGDSNANGAAAGAVAVFDLATGSLVTKLAAGDPGAFAAFGESLAIDGNLAIVGAPHDDENTSFGGSAYVFDLTSNTQLHKLYPHFLAGSQQFGRQVDISGNTAIVSAKSTEGVSVFDAVTGARLHRFTNVGLPLASSFGADVALDGSVALVSALRAPLSPAAPWPDSVYVYDTTTGDLLMELVSSDWESGDDFGCSIAIEGSIALVGAQGDDDLGSSSGAVYVIDLATGVELHKLVADDGELGDKLGAVVALDGSFAAVAAPGVGGAWGAGGLGAVYVFDIVTGTQLVKLRASDGVAGQAELYGESVALAGTTVLVGAPLSNRGAPPNMNTTSGALYVYEFGSNSESYCTAGTSSAGCQALISGLGVPCTSATTGFALRAESVQGGANALFLSGTNGRQASAWGNGSSFQCVVPPVQRLGLLEGNGTPGTCQGTFALDLNAHWAANPAQVPGAGAVVQAQLWYRDPFNTSNQSTSLSDALEFTVAP